MAELYVGENEASLRALIVLPIPRQGHLKAMCGLSFSGCETGHFHRNISISVGLNIYIRQHCAKEKLNYLLCCVN